MADILTEMVQFPSDTFTIKAFLARPASASGRLPAPPLLRSAKQSVRGQAGLPAVLVIQEWWGLNDHIKEIAGRFAQEGYVALAPDLYSRLGYKVTKDPNEAAGLMNALSSQAALRDLNATTQCLKRHPQADPLRIGVVGFCMGGTFALMMATHNSDLKAAVSFYGKVPPLETLESLVCPVLYHYAGQDGWVTQQEPDRLRQAMSQYGKRGEVVTYPSCQHAFFNDTRPEVYSTQDAAEAWRRTLQFFAIHLR